MRATCLLLVLFFAAGGQPREDFRYPEKFGGLPSEYLAGMKVSDASRQLTGEERHALARLFARAYVASVRDHGQDGVLPTGAPVYRLLAANFPEVRAREGEGGAVIFLGAVARFFNSLPEYRGDVVQVLRAGQSRRYCR